MAFPETRLRRLRSSEAWRRMTGETDLGVERLVYPLFVCPGDGVRRPIVSMPGCFQLSVDELVREAREVRDLGIPAILLFGIPGRKDPLGSEGYSGGGIVAQALRELRAACPELLLWADVCLCEYTSHGHCGVLRRRDAGSALKGAGAAGAAAGPEIAPGGECASGGDFEVDNDATLELLARMAVAFARAGAHAIAPSDMMDGRVGAIRRALDAADFSGLPIISYSVKYASAFYGPFREAAQSAPQFGDRRGYQMNPANAREALREAALDIEEGADMIMVKPALPYLDVIRRVKDQFHIPVAAYNVSGEYAMIKAAAERGWLDESRAMREVLLSIRRAGADVIITYFAKDFAKDLAKDSVKDSARR